MPSSSSSIAETGGVSAPQNAVSPTRAVRTHEVYFETTCTSRGSLRRLLNSKSSASSPLRPKLPTVMRHGGPRSSAAMARSTSSAETTRRTSAMPHSDVPPVARMHPGLRLSALLAAAATAATRARPRIVDARSRTERSATLTSARRTSSAINVNGFAGSSARDSTDVKLPRSTFNTEVSPLEEHFIAIVSN